MEKKGREWGIVGKKGREWGVVGKKGERVGDSGEERKGIVGRWSPHQSFLLTLERVSVFLQVSGGLA